MASQNRTITLTLDAQTSGVDSVRDLATEIQKLGKKGGDAAPEFEKLSAELNDLAQRQDAVSTFNELSTAVEQSKVALNAAKTAANAEISSLQGLKQALDYARDSEQLFAVGVKDSQEKLREANQAVLVARSAWSDYVAKIGGAKKANDEQKVTLKELSQAIREAKAGYDAAKVAVGALAPEYETLNTATTAAAAAVKAQESALAKTNKSVTEASTKYDSLRDALQGADTALGKLGIDSKNTTAEQDRLTQSMSRLTTQADQLKSRLNESGNSAQTAAQKIASAFAGTGVQAADKLNAEILKIDQALLKLARDTSINETEFNSAFTAGKARIAELNSELRRADTASKGFGSSISSAFKSFGPATLVFNGITRALDLFVESAKKIPEITAQFQTMERTLRILTGSTESARKEMAYIIGVADRVGTGIKGAADGYIKLTAATKDTNLEGAQTKRIFEAVSGAMGVLGASSDETTNALQAVTQIVSKGVVSMEEFRQQLGERLPQALQATAKELGISTAELNDLISAGKLTADDVLPALASGLEKVYKTGERNDTLRGQWAQFTNSLQEAAAAIGNTGIVEGLLNIGRVATTVVVGLVEGFTFAGQTVAAVMRGLKWNGDFAKEMNQLTDKASAFTDSMGKMVGIAPTSTKAIVELAKEAKAAGQEFFVLGDGTKVATATILEAGDGFIKFVLESQKALAAAEGFATSSRKSAEATRAAGEATITSANAIGSETDKRNAATAVADKNAAALSDLAVAEGKVLAVMEEEALQRAIALRDGQATSDAHKKQLNDLGLEIGKRKAVVEGVERQAEAQRLLALATKASAEADKDNGSRADALREKYLGLISATEILRDVQRSGIEVSAQLKTAEEQAALAKKLYIDALGDEAIATEAIARISGNEKQQREAAILTVQRHLQAMRDVGEARTDEYRKSELQLAQLQIEREALNDNSGALVQLRTEYENTRAKVEELRLEKAAGKEVSDELTAADLRAAEASAMYADALKDQKEKIDAVKNAKLGELDVKSAGIRVEIATLKGYADVAKAMGDEQGAAQALMQIKRLEIQLAQLTAEAKKLEAEASKKIALAKIEEIKATGIMTDAKRAEIRALEASVKVKEAEAQIAGITAESLRNLAGVTESAGGAADNASSGYNNMADSMNNAADAAKRLREEQAGAGGTNSNGVRTATLPPVGQRTAGAVDFTETLYKRGASIEEQKLAQKYVGELYQRNQATFLTGNLGNEQNAARLQKLAINDAVDKAIAAARQELKTGQAVDLGTSVSDIIARNNSLTPLRGVDDMISRIKNAGNEAKAQTININVGSRSAKVNVASKQDADALAGILQHLESESTRTF